MNALDVLRGQIAKGEVSIRLEGRDRKSGVVIWAELTAQPTDGVWSATVKLGDGTSMGKAFTSEGAEKELTEILLTLKSWMTSMSKHGTS
jgi:hypothetical protein